MLFNIENDFSESTDLAKENPAKLEENGREFNTAAERGRMMKMVRTR